MNKGKTALKNAFEGRKAFIPFITCGDPDLESTVALIDVLEENGADIIELGIPFSDPTAEGPVIQEASLRALQAGCSVSRIFEMLEARMKHPRPSRKNAALLFMTYANVVMAYGLEDFCSRASAAGISALILPDVPFEESAPFKKACSDHEMVLISMIAPTSQARIEKIASQAEGFLYLVSSLGVTGMRSSIESDLAGMMTQIRRHSEIPVAIGFGISSPQQAAAMASIADGAIMGSKLVRTIAENPAGCRTAIGTLAASVRHALDALPAAQ